MLWLVASSCNQFHDIDFPTTGPANFRDLFPSIRSSRSLPSGSLFGSLLYRIAYWLSLGDQRAVLKILSSNCPINGFLSGGDDQFAVVNPRSSIGIVWLSSLPHPGIRWWPLPAFKLKCIVRFPAVDSSLHTNCQSACSLASMSSVSEYIYPHHIAHFIDSYLVQVNNAVIS